jgi:thiol:disulfide interchange protein DsbC
MKKVVEKRKDIAFYIILFPLPMHKDAYGKSKAILCDKSLALLDDAFERKAIPPASCETKAVDENIALGQKLGITGTPAMIPPDGIIASGYRDADAIINLIDKK